MILIYSIYMIWEFVRNIDFLFYFNRFELEILGVRLVLIDVLGDLDVYLSEYYCFLLGV